MSNEVQFDIDQVQRTSFKPKGSILVRLVMSYSRGFIKDERQANYVLMLLSIVVLILSLCIFYSAANVKPHELTTEQLQQIENAKRLPTK